MSRNLEFTTRAGSVPCDSCRRPTSVGFYHLHRETPVLFECVHCTERTVGKGGVDAALARGLEVAFSRFEGEVEAP
jgi:hypothetical protein